MMMTEKNALPSRGQDNVIILPVIVNIFYIYLLAILKAGWCQISSLLLLYVPCNVFFIFNSWPIHIFVWYSETFYTMCNNHPKTTDRYITFKMAFLILNQIYYGSQLLMASWITQKMIPFYVGLKPQLPTSEMFFSVDCYITSVYMTRRFLRLVIRGSSE